MMYIVPTKRGLGVEIWGNYDDLSLIYGTIGEFWNDEEKFKLKGYENRNKLISGFSYELRKALEGSRLSRNGSYFSLEHGQYLGAQISWVHFLFTLSALRQNMKYSESDKLAISIFLQIEFWLEKAMKNYDEIGAKKLLNFIGGGIHSSNDYIYHYMRRINLDFFILGGGKRAFRKLPELLQMGVLFTEEYDSFRKSLENDAKKYGCNIDDLEINDDSEIYDIKW